MTMSFRKIVVNAKLKSESHSVYLCDFESVKDIEVLPEEFIFVERRPSPDVLLSFLTIIKCREMSLQLTYPRVLSRCRCILQERTE